MTSSGLRLVVVPSDPISAYEQAGYDWLERYYNPTGMFKDVFALSPMEEGERKAFGMTIRGVSPQKFAQTLLEIKPHVVRAYGGYWPADLVCRYRLNDVPVIVSVHDSSRERVHPSIRYADLVICLSRTVEREVRALSVNPRRIRILPNRVDLETFRPISDQRALQAVASRFPLGRHILHVGRKGYEKNLDTLIRALEFLPPEYSCIFVGMGDTAPYLSLAERLAVAARCFWIESVRNSELPLWYSWCDCMCVPSRWEGFGIVFIEAAACGAAIVTSDIGPMNEYLTHDVSACLVPDYENPRALSDAIQRVCEDTVYREVLSAGAIKAAMPFDRSIVDAAEAAIYREAVEMKSPTLARRLEITTWKTEEAMRSGIRTAARPLSRLIRKPFLGKR